MERGIGGLVQESAVLPKVVAVRAFPVAHSLEGLPAEQTVSVAASREAAGLEAAGQEVAEQSCSQRSGSSEAVEEAAKRMARPSTRLLVVSADP